jgi:hypothetical protein
MKNLQQQIQANLDVGHHVIIKDTDHHTYRMISPYKDSAGEYTVSGWRSSIQKCEESTISFRCQNLNNYNYQKYRYIGIYNPVYQTLKLGTKVKVREDAREWCEILGFDSYTNYNHLIGRIYKIENLSANSYFVFDSELDKMCDFPLQALEVITEGFEEENDSTIEYTMDEIAEKLGVDVKNLKIKK